MIIKKCSVLIVLMRVVLMTPLIPQPIKHDNAYSTAVTKVQHWSGFELTRDTPCLALTASHGTSVLSLAKAWARIWWRHQMETFSALLDLWAGNSPVNSPHKGQWRGALMFSLICAWINGWVNNREAGYLRRHRTHYDVIVMIYGYFSASCEKKMWHILT